MKSFIQIILLIHCAIVFFTLKPLQAQELEYEVTLKYPESDPRINVTVVVGKEHKTELEYFKNITLESLRITEEIFKIPFIDSFSVVYDPRSDFHNGLATVVPSNRIYIHTEVPSIESSIGLVKQAHLETTVHEMAHMMMLQQRRGVFIPLSWVFGNLSRPNAVFPRWVHEGMAVWAESHLGGRGTSGLIEAEKRKYAEYFQRKKKHPLRNDLLDGSLELNAMEPGNMPYHFGYLMIEELMKGNESKSAGELLKKSAVLPGWFFHRLFSKNNKSVRKVFNQLRDNWSQTPLAQVPQRAQLFEAIQINGPYKSGSTVSWNSIQDKRQLIPTPKTYLARKIQNDIQITEFTRGGMRIAQNYWSETLNLWVVLAYAYDFNTNNRLGKRLLLIDSKGNLKCENTSIKRIREIALDKNQLAWIRSDEKGFFYFEKAALDNNCKISEKAQLLAKSEMSFERFSHPWIQGDSWLLSKSRGRDLSHDLIMGSNNFLFESKEGALAYPEFITHENQKKLLVSIYKSDYRGPALIDLENKKLQLFNLQTEANSSTWDPNKNEIIAKVSFWDKDSFHLIAPNETPKVEAPHKTIASLKEIPIPELNKKTQDLPVEKYNIFPSIFPRFWFPSYETYDRGTTLAGSTFFTDLSDDWQGSFLAGFDTGAQRPIGLLTFDKKNLGLGMLNQWSLEGLTNFRYIGNDTQDIQIAKTQLQLSQRLNSRFMLGVYPGIEYRRGTKVRNIKDYSVAAPALSLLFASPHATNVRQGAYQITHFADALYFNGNVRWLPDPSFEVYSNFQGKLGPVGYLLGFEYARTQPSSFPILYYEWGGRSSFSTLDSGFLARGFPSSIGPALQLLRPHAEIGFRIWDFNRGIPWNRLHLKDIEIRPIYEVITTDLYTTSSAGKARKTNVRMGSEYFHTVGLELDFFVQALHYANFKASIGYFHGIGRSGEDNVGFKLQSQSDFF